MDSANLVGSVSCSRELYDCERARIGGEDRVRSSDRVQFLEQGNLGLEVFDNRLNDEVAVLQVGQIVGEGDVGERLISDRLSDLLLGDLLFEALFYGSLHL